MSHMKYFKHVSILILVVIFTLLSCDKERDPNPLIGTEWSDSESGNVTYDNSQSWHHFEQKQTINFTSNTKGTITTTMYVQDFPEANDSSTYIFDYTYTEPDGVITAYDNELIVKMFFHITGDTLTMKLNDIYEPIDFFRVR